MYAILKGYKISLEKIIEQSILRYQNNKFRGHLRHPAIITYSFISKGVKFNKEEDEKCPKTYPFTLTAITKPSLDKGKGKMKEIEEGRKDSEQTGC